MNAPAPALDLPHTAVAAADHPPRLPFVLAAGVTAHHRERITPAALAGLKTRVGAILEMLKAEAARVHGEAAEFFSAAPPTLRLLSPLAGIADQMVAEEGLEHGFELHVVLPFDRARARSHLRAKESRARFDALLARASSVLELLGGAEDALEPHTTAGLATVAHSDLLIAIWDDRPKHERGAAGEIARQAVTKAKPIIHVPLEERADIELRWGAFEPSFVTEVDDPATIRRFSREELGGVFDRLFAPPSDPRERGFIRVFNGERRRPWRWRIEYPLLLALAGVAPFRRRHWHTDQTAGETLAEWRQFREACDEGKAVSVQLAAL